MVIAALPARSLGGRTYWRYNSGSSSRRSQRRFIHHPRLVRLVFVVANVAMGQDFLRVLQFLPVSGIPPVLHAHASTTGAVLSQNLTSASNNAKKKITKFNSSHPGHLLLKFCDVCLGVCNSVMHVSYRVVLLWWMRASWCALVRCVHYPAALISNLSSSLITWIRPRVANLSVSFS